MKTGTKWALLGSAVVLGIAIAERAAPLRKRTRPQLRRDARNLAMGAACAAVVQAVEVPLVQAIARSNERQGAGIAQKMPRGLQTVAGVLAMDYGFYVWHVATHKVPFLWRFHRVHHVDPDLTASTAVRFHAVDMVVSLPWRLVQARLSGAGPRTMTIWRNFFNLSILFHHANLSLPGKWDRRLARIVTTPRMHGIHHARHKHLRDSNWTSGISIWDRLHGTYVDTDQPGTGVADPRAEADVALLPSLAAPFRETPEQG